MQDKYDNYGAIRVKMAEYLVNFEFFVEIMDKNGFKPVVPTSVNKKYSSIFKKDNFDKQNIGYFKNIISKIPEIEKRKLIINIYHNK